MMRLAPLLLAAALVAPAPAFALLDGDAQAARLQACVKSTLPQGLGAVRDRCVGLLARPCMETPQGMSTHGAVQCMSDETDAWDRILNAAWPRLRAMAKRRDAGQPGEPSLAEAELKAQRAWLAWRDEECRAAWLEWAPGSQSRIAAADCLLSLTGMRAVTFRLRVGFEE